MLQNAYFLAKIGADTAENEQRFAENLLKIGNYPTASCPRGRSARGPAVRSSDGINHHPKIDELIKLLMNLSVIVCNCSEKL